MNALLIFRSFGRFLAGFLPFCLVIGLSACDGSYTTDPYETSLRPGWFKSQEFHLESRYRNIIRHTEDSAETLDPIDGAVDGTVDGFADGLSEAVYWRYQVIEQGLKPRQGEDFYEYAVMGGTRSPLTVIKASLDPEMNLGHELVASNPKIYMVFREDRMRMAGMVTFHTAAGERVSQAVTVDKDQMNRSFSVLSQSSLSVIPHFVPPFPIRAENRRVVLEDGQETWFANATDKRVDVVYENALDNTFIAETWEDGQPWATASITPTLESRMLSLDEVHDIKGSLAGTMSNHNDDEDFDYIELLKQPVNLSEALRVDDLIGRHSFSVREGYRPWAGSWWRQSEGALIFGYRTEYSGGSGAFPEQSSSLDTISELNKESFEESAKSLQGLSEDLRTLRKNGEGSSSEYSEKLSEYREVQGEFNDDLNSFYSAVQQGINGGQITVSDGVIAAADNWSGEGEDAYRGFEFEVDTLSPLDKFALLQQLNNQGQGRNPWMGPAWEMLNHWSPAGSAWWGHCNGWSAAAILTTEPTEEIEVSFGSSGQYDLALSPADQKGLLTESYYSQLSSFYGARYNGNDGDDISDLSPKAVLQLLSTYIGQRGVPLVFDTSPGEQVWNYPAWAYELTLDEVAGPVADAAAGLVNINMAGMDELQSLWGIGELRARAIIDYREAHGPFQEPRDVLRVDGVGYGLLARIQDDITVSQEGTLREFDGGLRVRFTTDGVGYTHIDSDPNEPEGFWKEWHFSLSANSRGEIVSGEWDNAESAHPDFAWVPYANTPHSGRSENPYLLWNDLQEYIPGVVRE